MKKALKILLVIILIPVIFIFSYLAYMQVGYYRIEDNKDLMSELKNNSENVINAGTEYTIVTSNIGFGAYDHDFAFFMDRGILLDDTEVQGTMSRARSEEIAKNNAKGSAEVLVELNPDIVLMQEVDINSTRSYYIDQRNIVNGVLKNYANVHDLNMHTSYLLLPISEPHGYCEAGLLSMSKFKINSAVHRSLPLAGGFINKFKELDRCLTVMTIPVDNGKQLTLINLHLSAYDKGGVVRQKQLNFLFDVLKEEKKKGNYVIAGGDFNHILSKDYPVIPSKQKRPPWVFDFPEESLPEGFRLIHSDNVDKVGTCRGSAMPYERGFNFQAVIDGFIVSDNIDATSSIMDSDYMYSDHNPVKMDFILKKYSID